MSRTGGTPVPPGNATASGTADDDQPDGAPFRSLHRSMSNHIPNRHNCIELITHKTHASALIGGISPVAIHIQIILTNNARPAAIRPGVASCCWARWERACWAWWATRLPSRAGGRAKLRFLPPPPVVSVASRGGPGRPGRAAQAEKTRSSRAARSASQPGEGALKPEPGAFKTLSLCDEAIVASTEACLKAPKS